MKNQPARPEGGSLVCKFPGTQKLCKSLMNTNYMSFESFSLDNLQTNMPCKALSGVDSNCLALRYTQMHSSTAAQGGDSSIKHRLSRLAYGDTDMKIVELHHDAVRIQLT